MDVEKMRSSGVENSGFSAGNDEKEQGIIEILKYFIKLGQGQKLAIFFGMMHIAHAFTYNIIFSHPIHFFPPSNASYSILVFKT